MAMPAGNMFWRDIPVRAKVREHGNYFEVIDGKKRYVANWSSQDAREAQAWLKRRASGSVTRTHATHATKRQLPPIPKPTFEPGERELIEEAAETVYYHRGGEELSKQDFREEVFNRLTVFDITLTTALVDEIYAQLKRPRSRHSGRSSHATKPKSPAQLDREIAAHLRPGYDNGPGAWERGYEYAKESARHETQAEMRQVLRRSWPGASAYDEGFIAAYQDLLGILRKQSHATKSSSSVGYEVSRTALGHTRSAVFTTRQAAKKFQAANAGSSLREVELDDSGRIVRSNVAHATKSNADEAIDTVHTLKMSDGRVITTTWHNTRAEANKRVKNTAGRDPSKDRVLPGSVLGKFKAVTWSY